MKKTKNQRTILSIKIIAVSLFVGYKFFDNTNTSLLHTEPQFTLQHISAQTTTCGDNLCDTGEDATSCAADCGCNRNNICETNRKENYTNCTHDCTPPAEISCTDGIDNDLDGKIDCKDPDCNGDPGPGGVICQTIETFCSDNMDNDNDGKIDCEDSDCSKQEACLPVCGDEIRNKSTEECDDGNTINGDGCDSECKNEIPQCTVNLKMGKGKNSSTLSIESIGSQKKRVDISKIDRGDETNTSSKHNFPIYHTYTNTGEYNMQLELTSKYDSTNTIECTNTIKINSIQGCTDKYALNFDSNATTNNGSCTYPPVSYFVCDSLHITTDQKEINQSGHTSHEVTYSRIVDPTIFSGAKFFDGANQMKENVMSPLTINYDKPGVYNSKLLVHTTKETSHVCSHQIFVGQPGCIYSRAENYNPNASVNDGSCIFAPGDGFVQILTNQPYLPGGSIYGQIAYSHNPHRITIEASLSQSGSITHTFSPQLYANGLFSIPIGYKKTENNYIEPGEYTLFVKIHHYKGSSDYRIYQLNIFKPAICGNNEIENDEECDDGNTIDSDGCHSNCTLNICGDKIVNTSIGSGINNIIEECDDGNEDEADGCNSMCQLTDDKEKEKENENKNNNEKSETKNKKIEDTTTIQPYCGNNIIEGDEECDGNDGCSPECIYAKHRSPHITTPSKTKKQHTIIPQKIPYEEKVKIRILASKTANTHTFESNTEAIEHYHTKIKETSKLNIDNTTRTKTYMLYQTTILLLQKE